MANEPEIYSGAGEPVAKRTAGAPGRTSEQIRADIERQRGDLSQSVELLRGRVAELTDWRRQVREHRREIVIGAAVVGFAVGLAARAPPPRLSRDHRRASGTPASNVHRHETGECSGARDSRVALALGGGDGPVEHSADAGFVVAGTKASTGTRDRPRLRRQRRIGSTYETLADEFVPFSSTA